MTSQRLVEDFARWLWVRDTHWDFKEGARTPDSYMNEAAVFLAGELGQRLQHGDRQKLLRRIETLRDETADRANVEADLRAQLAEAKAMRP